MKFYQSFSEIYASGPYPEYSRRIAELLPAVLNKFDIHPSDILDMACGEGTFAVIMAKEGYRVTGIDLSLPMLQIARQKTRSEEVEIDFINQDMRTMSFNGQFDLVTCWYDSLNYLLTLDDLLKALRGAYDALKKDGLFIFDMNTIYGLSVVWQRYPCEIHQDKPDLLEIHRKTFDTETNNARLHITGFKKEGQSWSRIDETHTEHAFSLNEIDQCIESSGLEKLACWGNLREMAPPVADSGRIWIVCRK